MMLSVTWKPFLKLFSTHPSSPQSLHSHLDLRLCSEDQKQLPTLRVCYLPVRPHLWAGNHTRRLLGEHRTEFSEMGDRMLVACVSLGERPLTEERGPGSPLP